MWHECRLMLVAAYYRPHTHTRTHTHTYVYALHAPCHTYTLRFLPYMGMVTILMNDYPMLKFGLIGALGLLVITSKD